MSRKSVKRFSDKDMRKQKRDKAAAKRANVRKSHASPALAGHGRLPLWNDLEEFQ
jgi:hypothetical protein